MRAHCRGFHLATSCVCRLGATYTPREEIFGAIVRPYARGRKPAYAESLFNGSRGPTGAV